MDALNIVEFRRGDAETGEETINIAPHQRYIYRGYLQVAACDLTRGGHPCLWLITWDPTQPMATRPLAIQKDGTWYCYGWDLTKNICEVFGQAGYIRTIYSYTPYGSVTEEGDVTQPLQWSSEYADPELSLVYYNYRYYNPTDGRWTRRDPIGMRGGVNLYAYIPSGIMLTYDIYGLLPCNKSTSGKIVAINSFTFTLIHATKDDDFNISISNPTSTIKHYVMEAVTGEAESIALDIVSELRTTIASSLKSVLSTFNALSQWKKRAILATSIGTLYREASLEIGASRCCCREKKNVYFKKIIKGNGYARDLIIDLRGLFLASVTNRKLFDRVVSEIGRTLSSMFSRAVEDLNDKTC